MKANENQKSTRGYKVFIHRPKTWVEVIEDQYYAYHRDICPKKTMTKDKWLCYLAKYP